MVWWSGQSRSRNEKTIPEGQCGLGDCFMTMEVKIQMVVCLTVDEL